MRAASRLVHRFRPAVRRFVAPVPCLPLVCLALAPAVAHSVPPFPTGLIAFHRSGQTFLTWSEAPGADTVYRVYRSATPITTVSGLSALGEVDQNSTLNERASTVEGGTIYYRVVEGVSLPANGGLFVHSTEGGGAFFYAVTSADLSGENTTLIPGVNALPSAVVESLAVPEPVLQRTLTVQGRPVDVYTHWVSDHDTPLAPTMSVEPSIPFTFSLRRRGAAATHPLILRLHARGGSYFNASGTGDAEEWILAPDDYLPNDIRNTFWYGYHDGFDLETGLGVPETGVVVDYTVRRVRWTLEWALANLPIDTERVYLMGSSMGGLGSAFLRHDLRDQIAAAYTIVPKFDFSFLHDPDPVNAWNEGNPERAIGDRLWGSVPTNLPSSDGIPVYDRLNAGYLATRDAGVDLPPLIAFNGKHDTVVGWAEKIPFYEALLASGHGHSIYWDGRTHSGSGAEWLPAQDALDLYGYRLHESFPAFGATSADGTPGDGNAADGDAVGSLGAHVTWDRPPTDLTSEWEVVLRLQDLESTLGNIAAPDPTLADVIPRRLQSFLVAPNETIDAIATNASTGVSIAQWSLTASSDGVVHIPAVPVTGDGTRLRLQRVAADVPNQAPVPRVTIAIQVPNPARSTDALEFTLPRAGNVRAEWIAVNGTRAVLLAGRSLPEGTHRISLGGAIEGRAAGEVGWIRLVVDGRAYVRQIVALE